MSRLVLSKVKVAERPGLRRGPVVACHVAPVYLNTAACVTKAISLIGEASRDGAQLVVFPEAWIPGFPMWSALANPLLNHDLFVKLAQESVFVDGQEIEDLKKACRKNGVFASIGFNERSRSSVGCLWNSSVLISDEGKILNHHRKMVPTYFEKLTWAPGDGAGLRVVDTGIGRIGGLICGENGNPLARYALAAQSEQIHISHWPPIFPTRPPSESGNFNLASATRIRVAAACFEAKCFGVVSGSPVGASARDLLVYRDPSSADILDNSPRGSTMFIDPMGNQFGDEIHGEDEGIAYAEFDLNKCIEPKQFHDFVGGYQRYDVFNLNVNRSRQEPVAWQEDVRPERSIWNAAAVEPAQS
ncbi:hypothetical protein I317_03312 [Kwoniella heveanensis CBS 569]|nr:hypothetical protein I317_03312 [Kwoniella heveanensis CBS 569]